MKIKSVFNYDEIPTGYYYQAMLSGSPVQRFWHRHKFLEVCRVIKDHSVVLDFGCGPGSFLHILAENLPNTRGVGVDIAASQIDFARKNIQSLFPGQLDFIHIDSFQLPFADQTFDYITSIEVIEHLHPYLVMKALSEMKRLLKPGGKILITTPNYFSFWPIIEYVVSKVSKIKYHQQHINQYTPHSLNKVLESAGLETEGIKTIFVLAPFLSVISNFLAEFLNRFEYLTRFGSLIFIQVKIDKDCK